MLTADQRRKEPRKVPRPFTEKVARHAPKPGLTESADGGVRAVGASAFLQHAASRGQVGQR